MVEPSEGVPKGKRRRSLKDEGFEEVIEVKRNMSPSDVQAKIASAFGAIDYQLLSAQDGKFILSHNQKPSGDEVVELSQRENLQCTFVAMPNQMMTYLQQRC